MNDQEKEFLQEIHPDPQGVFSAEFLLLLTMLHLNSSSSPSAAATITTISPPTTQSPVSITTRTSKKRRSRSSSSSLQKKLFSKRTALFPLTTTTAENSPAAANFPSPPLQRSFSEPIKYNLTANIPETSINLNSSSTSAAADATTTISPSTTKSPVSINARTSNRRRSLSSATSLRKKLFSNRKYLFPPTTTTAAAATSPVSAINFPSPPLQRSFSELINYTLPANIPEASTGKLLNSLTPASTQPLLSPSPENSSKKIDLVSKSSSLPPLPPSLRRTSSTPIPSDYQIMALSATPPSRPPLPARTIPYSPNFDQESPNSKRLKRMTEKMQEMTQWCYEVIREVDEDTVCEDNSNKDDDEYESETHEEAVWVEENDGGLVMHFKCPCGKAHEILISGNNCYYRLM